MFNELKKKKNRIIEIYVKLLILNLKMLSMIQKFKTRK